ncbi:MAG: glycosyltransferase family 2 protein [Candidatus Shapirobacteria bacterium]|jgi:glycosyltransferase involved in cell wall biosynthesis
MNLTIIIPVYNEGKRAVNTVEAVLKIHDGEVVVVDDGSADNSFELLTKSFAGEHQISLLRHAINLGKGAAMKTGAKYAFIKGAQAVLFLDADGQHNPRYIPEFRKCLADYPVVFGYRELNKGMPLIRKLGNIFAAHLVNVLFGIKKKDLLCGYLGFRKEVYEIIKWNSTRYGIETEMATKVGKNKIAFKELKVDTIYIDKYKGVSLFDAMKILTQIPYWFFIK